MRRLLFFFAIVYFVQGMAVPEGIAYLPYQHLLREELRLSESQVGQFWALAAFGFAIKPVFGLVSDFLPLWGTRRRSYLLVSSALAAGSWLALAVVPSHSYGSLFRLTAISWIAFAFSDVLCDALMVQHGQDLNATGRFQSIQWTMSNVAGVIAGSLGGWIAQLHGFRLTALVSSIFPLAVFAATYFVVREPRSRVDREAFQRTWAGMRMAARAAPLWTAAVFIVLWEFAPYLGPVRSGYEQNLLDLSAEQQGWLRSIEAGAMALGAILYWKLVSRYRLGSLLVVFTLLGVASNLSYLLYRNFESGIAIIAVGGAITQIAALTQLDLAARVCPKGAEATVFAFLLGLSNLANSGSVWLGGAIYDYGDQYFTGLSGYSALILIGSGATLLCLAVVPFIPKWALQRQAP